MIRRTHEDRNVLIDPHTAVALHVAREQGRQTSPMVVLSTAHAAKFPDAVEAATGIRPVLPPGHDGLMDRDERITPVPNDVAAVEAFIQDHSRISRTS